MFEIFGIPSAALFGQLLIGLINGSFYALLSLGLAVIFGMLNIINFSHGAQYLLGAFAAYLLLQYSGIGYWPALIVAPVLVGITGMIVERLFLQRHCPCCRGRRLEGVPLRTQPCRLDWVGAEETYDRRQGQARRHRQAGQSILAMVAGRRRHGRYSLRAKAWHAEATMARPIDGAPTHEGGCGRAGQ
jgi:hypothetical protein